MRTLHDDAGDHHSKLWQFAAGRVIGVVSTRREVSQDALTRSAAVTRVAFRARVLPVATAYRKSRRFGVRS
jgi:hypothetical protein